MLKVPTDKEIKYATKIFEMENKNPHGGKRKGAGRPNTGVNGTLLRFNCSADNLEWCQKLSSKQQLSSEINRLISRARFQETYEKKNNGQ